MNYKEKRKRAAAKKRQKNLAREVELIAMGAGCWWLDDGYFEYQDNCEKCIGLFMNAVQAEYSVDRDSWIFSFHNFEKWSSPSKLAKALDQVLREKKRLEKEEAKEAD